MTDTPSPYTILRYGLQVDGVQVVQMPQGAEVLSVGEQPMAKEPIQLWAKVDTRLGDVNRHFRNFETEEEFPVNFDGKYVGSVCIRGSIVRHVYDLGEH